MNGAPVAGAPVIRQGEAVLKTLGLQTRHPGVSDGNEGPAHGIELVSENPTAGVPLGSVLQADGKDYERVMQSACAAFLSWRELPAPQRGQIVREIGDAFRQHKNELGALISLETGKIRSEGLGEVQEVADICDVAVGLSRQLHGPTLQSERPQHRLFEQWHPLGPVAIVSAFNFPVAVWAWNAMIAAVCGDVVIWKPSPKAPLTALAAQRIVDTVMARHGLRGIFNLVIGGSDLAQTMASDARIALMSFTGSVRAGRAVAQVCAQRLGRSLLELGGNNGIVVMDDANLELALRAIVFAAAGTAGQRCTSARRLFVQQGIAPQLAERLIKTYGSIRIGDPLDETSLMGPLIDAAAVAGYERAIATAIEQGGELLCGGRRLERPGYFVLPTLIRSQRPLKVSCEETFAPILYLVPFATLDQAIALHNAVPQGLSSAIFTENLRAAENFLSAAGSDCGIANVNLATTGAEVGGAFGGEKETGGGRAAGSDAWKAYMRRQTCTINYGTGMPLAQGVKFEL